MAKNVPIGRIAIPNESSTILKDNRITRALVRRSIKVHCDTANLPVGLEEVGHIWIVGPILE